MAAKAKVKEEELEGQTDPAFDPEHESVMVEVPTLESVTTQEAKPAQAGSDAVTTSDDDDDPGVAAMREQLEAAKQAQAASDERARVAEQRAEEALRIAQDRDIRARQAYAANEDAQHTSMQNALGAAQAEQEAATEALASAIEIGDARAQAAANAKIARAASQIDRMETGIAQLTEQRRQEAEWAEHQRRNPPPRKIMSPEEAREQAAASIENDPNLLPIERQWFRNHLEVRTSPDLMKDLEAACRYAARKGHTRGSEAYLSTVDEFMGYQNDKTKPSAPANPGARISAPVNRDPAGGNSGRRLVSVSQAEKDIAQALGMTVQEWAENKARNAEDRRVNPQNYNH